MKKQHGQKDVMGRFPSIPTQLGHGWIPVGHRAQSVVQAAGWLNIRLHHLVPYSPSPNLNPIERLWKVMNQQVRRNRYFPSPPEFRQAIQGFFDDI